MLDYGKFCGDRYVAERDSATGQLIRRSDPRSERIGAAIFVGVPILLAILWLILAPIIAEHDLQSLGKGIGELILRLVQLFH